jgi:hypothetical protein
MRHLCNLLLSLFVPISVMCSALTSRAVDAQTLSPIITPARIQVDEIVAIGATHALPPLLVRNPGSSSMRVQMSTELAGTEGVRDSRSWISFSPEQFSIQPGAAQVVRVMIHVPRAADPQSHTFLLRAGPALALQSEGVAVGVGAFVATTLTFSVGPGDLNRSNRILPHAIMAAGLAIATGMGSYYSMGWLSSFEVSIRRRPPSRPN